MSDRVFRLGQIFRGATAVCFNGDATNTHAALRPRWCSDQQGSTSAVSSDEVGLWDNGVRVAKPILQAATLSPACAETD